MFLKDILKGVTKVEGKLRPKEYFIGIMVFAGSLTSDDYIDVIDGQQRLTVVTVLLSVITEKFLEIEQEKLAEATYKYIKENDNYGISKPKLKTYSSYPYFETYVQEYNKQPKNYPRSEEEDNIKETYEHFMAELEESNLKSKYNFDKNVQYRELLVAIRDQILKMNVISLLTE